MDALVALEPEWRTLWERDPRATPFQSPAWLLPWTRCLWGGGKMRTIAVWSGGRLTALLPLFFWGFSGNPCSQPETVRVSFLGAGITDYLDLLAEPGSEDDGAAAALSALAELRSEWSVCRLEELRPDSPLLRSGLLRELEVRAEPCSVCPVAPLPVTIEEHLGRLDAKFRTDLRRAENRLRARGEVNFASGIGLLEDLFRLHAARWGQRSEEGMLATARLQAFHRESAAALCAAGMLRMHGIFVDGACIAVLYNLAAKRRAYAYLSGFDPAWGKLSPGAVLLKHSIAEAIAEGSAAFDFLRKPEPFKYEWGAADVKNSTLVIVNSCLPDVGQPFRAAAGLPPGVPLGPDSADSHAAGELAPRGSAAAARKDRPTPA